MWINPKVDWVANPKNPRAEDFNRIEGNIVFLKNDIETKKGLIVDAVNTKRVSVTTDNTFQEIADVIRTIDLNYRKAEGTGVFTKVSDNMIRLQITGLPFKPSRAFAYGSFDANYGTYEGTPIWTGYSYAVIGNIVRPTSIAYYPVGAASISVSTAYQNDGFTITITGNNSLNSTSSNQNWYCYE